MTHWTEDVFVDRPWVFRPDLQARVDAAAAEVAVLLDLLATEHDLRPGTALDVGCGIGRHAVPLAARGVAVTGLDLSPDYLAEARDRAATAGVGGATDFVRGDMRHLDAVDGSFDLVANMWTSFGYFDDETNRSVLRGMREWVADGGPGEGERAGGSSVERGESGGGALVMELTNKEGVLADFDADGVTRGEQLLSVETREYDPVDSRLHTERDVFEPGDDGFEHVGTMAFDLRAYAPVELRERLLDAGFGEVTFYGSVEGEALDRESARMLAVARP